MALNGLCAILDEHHGSKLSKFKFYSNYPGFRASEVFVQEQAYQIKASSISDDNAIKWLGQGCDPNSPTSPNGSISIRVVWVDLNDLTRPWTLGIRESNKDSILDHFDIRNAYGHGFTCDRGLVRLPTSHAAPPHKQSFSLSAYRSIKLSWTYDSKSASTTALCVGYQNQCRNMQSIISRLKRLAWHPMFLAIVACVLAMMGLEQEVESSSDRIIEVEMRTKHSDWRETHWTVAEGSYASLSAQMSGSATNLASCECDRTFLDYCLTELSAYVLPKAIPTHEVSASMRTESEDCIRTLKHRSMQAEAQIRSLSRRADVQLTALFNLINQQDTQLSISVAKDSRILASASQKDSTAMKILAAVTVFFLPMTFVAALFSMPLFHWQTDTVGDSSMSEQFWVFWAVSAPLTFVTLTLCAAGNYYQRDRCRREKEADMEDLRCMIHGQGKSG